MYALPWRQTAKIRQAMCFSMLSYTHKNYFSALGYNVMWFVTSAPGTNQAFQVCPATSCWRRESCHFGLSHKSVGHLNAFVQHNSASRDTERKFQCKRSWLCLTGFLSTTWLLLFSGARNQVRQTWCPGDPWGAVIESLPLLFLHWKHVPRANGMLCLWPQTCRGVGITRIRCRVAWDVTEPSGNFAMNQRGSWSAPGFWELEGDLKPCVFVFGPTAKQSTDPKGQSQTLCWRQTLHERKGNSKERSTWHSEPIPILLYCQLCHSHENFTSEEAANI